MSLPRAVPAAVLAALVAGGLSFPAFAATSTTDAKKQQANIGNQINALNNQSDELSDQEADLFQRLTDINTRRANVDAQIAAVQAQMVQAQADMDAAQAKVDEQMARQAVAQAALNEAQAKLDVSTAKMKSQAVEAYVGGQTSTNVANFVLKADDMRDVSAASEYVNQVVDLRRQVVEENRALRGQAQDLADQVATARAQAEAGRNTVAQRQADLVSQKSQLEGLNAQAQADANAQAALLAEIEAKKGEINNQIAQLQAESDRIAALLRGSDNSGTAPPARAGALANPVPGARMTSPFGMRVNPVTGVYTLHAGQDFGVPVGTPLHAATSGKVVSAGWVSGYGNYTCINHGGGLATCYAHQSSILVSVGQQVSRNQVIGLSGNTGNSTGPHLHFEVRMNGTPVNPLGYI